MFGFGDGLGGVLLECVFYKGIFLFIIVFFGYRILLIGCRYRINICWMNK